MLKISVFILLIISFCACVRTKHHWKEIPCGLFLSPKGELGFATDPSIANVNASTLKGERCANVFLTTIGYDDGPLLSAVVDVETFEALGSDFYKDKNNIYSYYAMCSGGYLTIFGDASKEFRLIGSHYAFYNDHIFHYRRGKIKADPNSFKAHGPLAKDKDNYFEFGERTTLKKLKEGGITQEMLDALEN